jgi:hypothetical protein
LDPPQRGARQAAKRHRPREVDAISAAQAIGAHRFRRESELQLRERNAALGGSKSGSRGGETSPLRRHVRAMCIGARRRHGLREFSVRPVRRGRHGRGRSGPILILFATTMTAGAAIALCRKARTGDVTATAAMLRLRLRAVPRLAAASGRRHQRRLKRQHRGCQPYECGANKSDGVIHKQRRYHSWAALSR